MTALILLWLLIALTAWSAATTAIVQAARVVTMRLASQGERLHLARVPCPLRRARESAQGAHWSQSLSLA